MKRYIIFKTVVTIFLLSAIAVAFTGCNADEAEGFTLNADQYLEKDEPTAVAIILGKHSNAMAIPEDAYNSLEKNLKDAAYGGYACVIISDSTPTKVEIVPSDFFKENARNTTKLNTETSKRSAELIKSLKEVGVADSDEVDLLGAIREAKNALTVRALDDIKDKRIIIIDTGLSTSGDLNFQHLDFGSREPDSGSAEAIINELASRKLLPDLNGISVTFIGTADGLAEVAAPQELSTSNKQFIKDFWGTLAERCNAEVTFENAAGWDTPNESTSDADSPFPHVSLIKFPGTPIIIIPNPESSGGGGTTDPQPELPGPIEIEISEKQVDFKPGEAVYRDPETAKEILRDVAIFMREYGKRETFWVVGTTATLTPGGDGDLQLSLDRAQCVVDTLTELDVPKEKLAVLGLGAKFPWHINEFVGGKFVTTVAQPNRAVWILSVDENGKKFSQLKKAYENGELLKEAVERYKAISE